MTDGVQRQPALVSAMLEPSLYPHSPEGVELRETNTSWVFLAGDLAYKVKKAVSFPFLDYGTVERRHEMCREEIRLNRRLAPHDLLEGGRDRATTRIGMCSPRRTTAARSSTRSR